MKKIILLFLFAFAMQSAFSQLSFQAFLDSVVVHNKTLVADRQFREMQKISSRTGIYLPNPSVSYDQLFNPSGNYNELLVTQSFDFPTAYAHKSKIAELSSSQAEDRYLQSEREILIGTVSIYTELVSLNRVIPILERREKLAKQLESGFEKKLQLGDANVFESNRVRMELAKVRSEKQIAESRRKTLLLKLTEMNGGLTLAVNDTVFPLLPGLIVSDTIISGLVNRYPEVKLWETETMIAQSDIELQKSLSYPKFEVGYRQDFNTGLAYSGFHAGITIPLFENKNKVSTARARQLYTTQATYAYKISIQNNLSQLYSEYLATQQSVTDLSEVVKTINTPLLLVKAYKSGQLNYTEFFSEYDNYYKTALYLEDLYLRSNSLRLQLFVLSEGK